MPVTSSEVVEDGGLQRDGRKFVRFEFTDHTGKVHTHFGYRKYPGGTNAETQRAALIPDLEASLVRQEKKAIWGMSGAEQVTAMLNPDHAAGRKVEQFIARRLMRSEDPEDIERCEEYWIHMRDTYSGAALRTRLDFTAEQTTNFRQKMRRVLEDLYPTLTAKQIKQDINDNLEVEEIEETP